MKKTPTQVGGGQQNRVGSTLPATDRQRLLQLPLIRPHLIPVGTNKRPLTSGWQEPDRHFSDQELIKAPAIGLRLGYPVVAVDFDPKPDNLSQAERTFEQRTGRSSAELPISWTVTSGKPGRRQVLLQVDPAAVPWLKPSSRDALEIRWRGQQSVIDGHHPETGRYQWLPGRAPWECDLAEVPEWLLQSSQASDSPAPAQLWAGDLPPRPEADLLRALERVPEFFHDQGRRPELVDLAFRLWVEVGAARAEQLLAEHSPTLTDLPSYFSGNPPSRISPGSIWPFLNEHYGVDLKRHDLKRGRCRASKVSAEVVGTGVGGNRQPPRAEEALKALFASAVDLLSAKVPARERLPLLRTSAVEAGLSIRDPEIYAAVAAARKHLRGEADGISPEMELDIPDAQWIWESLIAAGTLNMVTALQKVGKTALLLQFIRLWSAGVPAFLGHELAAECPGVIIVGTDMGLADWRNMLVASGLMEKTAAGKYRLLPPILQLWHREEPLHLDESGLDKLASLCEANPGALILIDSFAAVTAPLGIDEFKPEAAEPLYALCEAVEPYGATTVLIHHSSKSRSGEQASNAARGSNAITAVPSQLINLAWLGDPKQDRRIELTSEGRGALPSALVVEQVERCKWISHGDAAAIRRTEGRDKAERGLSDRQGLVLDEVRDQWEQKFHEMDAIYLRAALPAEFSGKDPQRQASATLEQLARKELLEKRKVPVSGRGEVVLYRPFGADVRKAKLRAAPPSRANNHQNPPDPPIPLETTNRVQPSDQPPFSPPPSADEGSEGAEGAGDIPAREGQVAILGLELVEPKRTPATTEGSAWDAEVG